MCAQHPLTGRYGAKAPHDSATNSLLSGYLWLICRGAENILVIKMLKLKRDKQKLKEGQEQTGGQPPWNGNNWRIINTLTLCKPLFVFQDRFSQPLNCWQLWLPWQEILFIKNVLHKVTQVAMKTKLLSNVSQGHYGSVDSDFQYWNMQLQQHWTVCSLKATGYISNITPQSRNDVSQKDLESDRASHYIFYTWLHEKRSLTSAWDIGGGWLSKPFVAHWSTLVFHFGAGINEALLVLNTNIQWLMLSAVYIQYLFPALRK